jgi:tetratricopeptide (TPR) repeat protein
MFYAPVSPRRLKRKMPFRSYSRAITLLEADMKDIHRWLYLNTLVSLAKSYQETGNRAMAIITYQKALDYEPDFKWVKEDLLPKVLNQ